MSMFDTVVPRDPDVPGPVWLTPETVTLIRTPGGLLRAEVADRCYRRVAILRAMPLSRSDEYLSVRCQDEEIGIIRRLADLPADQQAIVAEELEQRYFRPRIVRLKRVKDQSGTFHWDTETDRGPAQFSTRHPRHSVVRAGAGRWYVSDLNANRYELREDGLLDTRSQRILETLLA